MKTKSFKTAILGMLLVAIPLLGVSQNNESGDVTSNPGYLHLDKLIEENEAYLSSEVYLQNYILKMVAKMATKSEPDFAKMLSSIHLIRVLEFEFDDEGKNSTKVQANRLVREINKGGWDTLVRTRDDSANVNISIRSDGENHIYALAIISWEEHEMVVVNIVGDIDLEMLSRLGEQFDIDSLEDIEDAAEDA